MQLVRSDGRVVCERCRVADTVITRMKGLLGCSELEAGEGLWIEPAGSIHTFFMRFPIDAVFLDRGGAVVAVKAELQPWRIGAARGARSVVELASGEAARRRIAVGEWLSLAEEEGDERAEG